MNIEDLHRPLQAHPFLAGLSETEVSVLTGCAKNVRLPPGEFLLREGDEAGTFYLIRQGRVSLEVHRPAHEALRVETVGPGDVLGISWMFPPARVMLDARAIESVLAIALDGACLQKKMEADHDLGYALVKRLLRHTQDRLERVRLQRLDVYNYNQD